MSKKSKKHKDMNLDSRYLDDFTVVPLPKISLPRVRDFSNIGVTHTSIKDNNRIDFFGNNLMEPMITATKTIQEKELIVNKDGSTASDTGNYDSFFFEEYESERKECEESVSDFCSKRNYDEKEKCAIGTTENKSLQVTNQQQTKNSHYDSLGGSFFR